MEVEGGVSGFKDFLVYVNTLSYSINVRRDSEESNNNVLETCNDTIIKFYLHKTRKSPVCYMNC